MKEEFMVSAYGPNFIIEKYKIKFDNIMCSLETKWPFCLHKVEEE